MRPDLNVGHEIEEGLGRNLQLGEDVPLLEYQVGGRDEGVPASQLVEPEHINVPAEQL